MTIVSAPLGTGAPVKILTASPLLRCPRKLLPAGTLPMHTSFLGDVFTSILFTAYPSIADTATGGWHRLARTSTAVTLFMADVSEVSSVETTEISLIIFSSALSTDNRDLFPTPPPRFSTCFFKKPYIVNYYPFIYSLTHIIDCQSCYTDSR